MSAENLERGEDVLAENAESAESAQKGVGEKKFPFWKRLFFSKILLSKNKSHKIAYIAVLTTFAIAANVLEIEFMDTQFSLTILSALLIGIIIGPIYGFLACFLGDFIGYIINSYNVYMFWVGLATGTFALLSGLLFNLVPTRKKWLVFVKLGVICIATFFVCTITINSTGFYFYTKFTNPAIIEEAGNHFGGEATFWAYVLYRLLVKGQIWNSLANYTLFFIAIPALNHIKTLKLKLY